jgi:predicted aspartyl protease
MGQFSVEKPVAPGSVLSGNQQIGVRTVTVGPYVIHNVQMVVTDDGADLLLGLPVLKTIGSFTIDQSHQQIRFN